MESGNIVFQESPATPRPTRSTAARVRMTSGGGEGTRRSAEGSRTAISRPRFVLPPPGRTRSPVLRAVRKQLPLGTASLLGPPLLPRHPPPRHAPPKPERTHL